MATPKEHIEEIRKSKFSIGGELNPLTEDLHQSVKNLSAELYAKDVHFLMEIIQNAEDNEYSEEVEPSLEFVITSEDITATGAPATLLIFNNERGFSSKNIDSICSVGRSTKKGLRRRGYIGEKGIGFKSVFLITAQPYIFSNGYQIRFNEEPCPSCKVGYIVPEWIEENPTLADIQQIYGPTDALPTTTIVLPLKPDKELPVEEQLSRLQPEILLFLSKIKRLSVRKDNEDPKLNTVNAISVSSETESVTRKNVAAESYTLYLSAEENNDENETECSYHMWRQKFPVKQENKEERRMEVEEWVITLAFPNGQRLNRGMNSPGIYAFLPTEMVTNFPFIIQADFILASSRETIVLDNKWNQGILDCVASAFVNAFISLVKTTEGAPGATLRRMFEFLPLNPSLYPKLNNVRDLIQAKLAKEDIVPSEPYKNQNFFYKPCEVGRIASSFWNILTEARDQGVSLHNLSSHGTYALNSAFSEKYADILDFLGVRHMDNKWYPKCIRSCNLVLGVSDDVYMNLLHFVAVNWISCFQDTDMKTIPLIKYMTQDGSVSLWSVKEVTEVWGKRICLLNDVRHISWLIDWNREFRCISNQFFMPKTTQEAMTSFPNREKVREWLLKHVEVSSVNVYDYATNLLGSLGSDTRLVIAFAHFICHSFSKDYINKKQVDQLCLKMPLVDSYGNVVTSRSGVLVPANESKWVGLIGSNPWKGNNYVELGEGYLCAGNYAGVYTSEKQLTQFLETHIGASDIPFIYPPDDGFPTISSPLMKENAFLLLDWIRNLNNERRLTQGKFLKCIREGCWLRTSVGPQPPSQSFLHTSEWGNLLQNGSELVDIPLIDQRFYGSGINNYKEELKAIGVMSDFGEACVFIGNRLMSLAANSNLTRGNVFSILNFIRFLRNKYLSPKDFINSIKGGRWLRTSRGERSPVGSILFDSEWKAASQISKLPFIDHEYYGEEINSFREELELLGVVIGFNQNYQIVADCFSLPIPPTSVSVDAILLVLKCIRHSITSDVLVSILKDQKWLRTDLGYKTPRECFLFNSEWGCILHILNGFPLIGEKFYGRTIFSYAHELKRLGVVVDFEEAAKVFARKFKELASSSSSSTLSFLACYKQLKQKSYKFPIELSRSIRDEKWLSTRLGLRSPKECILYDLEWESLSPIASLPFIDDNYYGNGIQQYRDELKAFGVVVKFKEGSNLVASGLNIPQNPNYITPKIVVSLLECIRNLLEEKNGSLPKEFLERINKRWLKTYMGYRRPEKCLLFDSEWGSFLQHEDGPFICEEFYGSNIKSYGRELNAIGVTIDVSKGCKLLASKLAFHTHFVVISRIYNYLQEFKWETDIKDASWIWIPNGYDKGEWVSPEECVLHDKDCLFGLQLNVLEKYYDKKLLSFFSMALGVRHNPCIDDYCVLWRSWEILGDELTPSECNAFWVFIVKHWNPKTKKFLAENLVKLPVNTGLGVIQLIDKQDVFIPDDLQLKDLFDKASPDPIFVWYPEPSLPSLPRNELNEIYGNIGVRTISESVQKDESSVMDGELKLVNPRKMLIQRQLIRLVLGFLADASLEMDAEKRHQTVKYLLGLNVFETKEPITVSYSLSLSSGKSVEVNASRMIRWERDDSKLFSQKIDRSAGHRVNIEFATNFSQVIAEGLLWEKADRVAGLSELIKLGWLMEFEEETIGYLMKTKNLQLFMEDEEFLKSAFSSD